MKALITGIGGFAGSHLAEHLLGCGDTVWGVSLHGPGKLPAPAAARVKVLAGDTRDTAMLAAVLAELRPDAIFHLAARAEVGGSWKDPAATYQDNILGQLGLFQAILESGQQPTVLVAGSHEEYGLVRPEELPVTEDNPLRPLSPYAVTKVTQDLMGLQYFLSHHLPVVRVRPAGHIGPRQGTGFVVPDFCRQIAEIEAGLRPAVLQVGNLAPERDLTDVRDVVRAYRLLVAHGTPGEVYNIGTGRAVSIQALLDRLLALSTVSIRVEVDPARFREADVPVTLSDYGRLHAQTGWTPVIPLAQSLRDTLDYWRDVVREAQ